MDDGSGPGGSSGGGGGTGCPDPGSDACEVFRIVNEERRSQGLAAYAYDGRLAESAEDHAADMIENNYFSHESQDGRSFADRARASGYTGSPSGENIAAGQRSPEDVMNSWMNSSGHRANILSDRSNEIGVGVVERHWVQVFGRRR